VYRCRQISLDRVVAVKVLTAAFDDSRARFLREQRALGRLTGHPNIVCALEVGETVSGYPFLVMEYHPEGSLEARIRKGGPLGVDELLRIGAKLANALEGAHSLKILHRDVKPGNVLLTDFGEPALCDFGIAHIGGGFQTATGIFTGSPAYTAPEIISGDPPSPASDVYGLGATLFSALTGHAAFERRTGEQVIAQFVRIASGSAPDLREQNIPDDVSTLIEWAMSHDPTDRPSAAAFAEAIERVRSRRRPRDNAKAPNATANPPKQRGRAQGNLPADVTSFVGRAVELATLDSMLSTARLVTLTAMGGVGKTRLALRAAAEAAERFADGVWLIELAEVRDGSLLIDVVAKTVGLRDQAGKPVQDMLFEFLASRELLLVLDNCEQVIDEAAKLTDRLLRMCPRVTILATSREALSVIGEHVLVLPPLSVPDVAARKASDALAGYDSVALFAERAVATAREFKLTERNTTTVAQICARLDGLPLAIELAAARLKVMSPEQVLEGLSDRYALLTRGTRSAPARQQSLSWSIGWSYDLCTSAEQQLWNRLSVFAGSFEWQAAFDICGGDDDQQVFLDLISALVEKSILIHTDVDGVVRFRFLQTIRQYGLQQITGSANELDLRRRHAHWFARLVDAAASDWVSPRQVHWIHRIEYDLTNIREALDFLLTDDPSAALSLATDLCEFWFSRAQLGEARRWLNRALTAAPPEPTTKRILALYYSSTYAGLDGDLARSSADAEELHALVATGSEPLEHALAECIDGISALFRGDLLEACEKLENAIDKVAGLTAQLGALVLLAMAHQFRGDLDRAYACNKRLLSLTEANGESVFRSYALMTIGVVRWKQGDSEDAVSLLEDGLRLAQDVKDPITAARCIEELAWIAGQANQHKRAIVMMAAAQSLARSVGGIVAPFPELVEYHNVCVEQARANLSTTEFEAAHRRGDTMNLTDAVSYALTDLD
jgi:non-specific serine/threonine protein kinase